MPQYNPQIHHRRSVRLKGYDYSLVRLYFIMICVQNREHLFGKIVEGEMILNDAGQIVKNEWVKSAEIRKEIEIHEFVVMPNHFHAIVQIVEISSVGAYDIRPIEELDICPNYHEHNVGAYGIRPNDISPNVEKSICVGEKGVYHYRRRKHWGHWCVDLNRRFQNN